MDNGADLWDFIGGWPVVNIHSIYKDQLGHLILVEAILKTWPELFVCDVTSG